MRPIAGYLVSTLALLTTALGCASSSEPRTWTPADYGSDYRATGMVVPKLIEGDREVSTTDLKCWPPPDTSGLVRIKCMLGVDGSVSKCQLRSVIAQCEQSFMDLATNIEKTHKYRPYLFNGRPEEVSYTYTFRLQGENVRSAPMKRSNRQPRKSEADKIARRLAPGEELHQIAGTPPTFEQDDGICVAPQTSAMVSLSCIIGVDGAVSGCRLFPAAEPVGCEQAISNAIATIEETYRFRPIVRDGQPVTVHNVFVFELLGEGVHPLQRADVPK